MPFDTETLIRLDKAHVWHPFTQMRDCRPVSQKVFEAHGSSLVHEPDAYYPDSMPACRAAAHFERSGEQGQWRRHQRHDSDDEEAIHESQ